MNKERIICSAIWYKELPLEVPEILQKRGFGPYNVDIGIVLCGWRHPNCIAQLKALIGKSTTTADVGENIQGFLTNKNRFVDRKEGVKIALESEQIEKLKYGSQLYSEDLY